MLCVQRAGFKEGRKVAQFIVEWEVATAAIGRRITAEEFSDWWRESPATTYRHLARFRTAFPELGERGMPGDLMTVSPAAARLPAGALAT